MKIKIFQTLLKSSQRFSEGSATLSMIVEKFSRP